MLHGETKRTWKGVLRWVLFVWLALALEVNQAYAADTVQANGSITEDVPAGGGTYTVQLSGAYTGTSVIGCPGWAKVNGSGSSYTITVSANPNESARNDRVTFYEERGTVKTTWVVNLSQKAKPHSHSWGNWTVTTAGTCTSTGVQERKCSTCGAKDSTMVARDPSNHAWGVWTTDTSPTCASEGSQHRNCTRCGARENGTIAKNANNHTGRKTTKVDSTCTKEGYTVDVCPGCGKELSSRKTINVKDHSWGNWIKDTDPGCETTGTKHRICSTCKQRQNDTIPAAGHTWGDWVASKAPGCETAGAGYRVCKKCNAKDTGTTIPALGHDDGKIKTVEATCTANGYTVLVCTRCNKEIGKRTVIEASHSWGKWITDKEAWCETEGTKHRNCTRCNARENGTIGALTHQSNGQPKTVPATCTKAGYTVPACTRCGKELGERKTIPATGHSWGKWIVDKEATCEEAGTKHRPCNKCGAKQGAPITRLGHTSNGELKEVPATCTKDGYKVLTCKRCGKELGERDVEKAKGHNWGDWIIDKEPKCEEAGTKHHACKRCGVKEGETIPKLNHLVEGQPKTKEPTCTEAGYKVIVCSRCNKEQGERTVLPAKGHKWGKWITDVESDCEHEGKKHRVCSVCHEEEKAVKEKDGHYVTGQLKVVEATCLRDGYSVVICNNCRQEMGERNVVPKNDGAHKWNDWFVKKKGDCENDGEEYRTCRICGDRETRKIPHPGHLVTGQRETHIPESGGLGYSVVVCLRCGKEMLGRTYFDVTTPQVTITFEITDNTSHEIIDGKLEVVVDCGKKLGDIFPKVKNPKTRNIAAWVDENGRSYNQNMIPNSPQKLKLRPVWVDIGEYVIILDRNGAVEGSNQSITVKYGEKYTLPKVKDLFDGGKGFEAWSTSPNGKGGQVFKDGQTKVNFAGTEHSITLYALWNESATISYFDPIRETTVTDQYTHNYTIKGLKELPHFEIKGLNFAGWKEWKVLSKKTYQAGDKSISEGKNVVLYPVYEVPDNSQRAIVYYDPRQGEGKDIAIRYYTKAERTVTSQNLFPVIKREYSFDKWVFIQTKPGSSLGPSCEWPRGSEFDVFTATKDYVAVKAAWKRTPVTLTLHYGYEEKKGVEKTEDVTVEEDNYELPTPERTGYIFRGWSLMSGERSRIVGNTYTVPSGGGNLYAIWDEISVTVEFYDGISGELLAQPKTISGSKAINGKYREIPGMKFRGWSTEKPADYPWTYYTFSNKTVFYQNSDLAAKLPYEKGTVKLYSCYEMTVSNAGRIVAIFDADGGSGSPKEPVFFDLGTEITIPAYTMSRASSSFAGWKLVSNLIDDNVYHAGDTVKTLNIVDPAPLYFVAQWRSDYRIELNPNYLDENGKAANVVDLSDKYPPDSVIRTADLSVERPGYTLIAWDVKQKYHTQRYGLNDTFYYPNGTDMIISAVWEENRYRVIYHNGFNEYAGMQAKTVLGKTKLSFAPDLLTYFEEDGYEFIGWTKENPNGFPCEVAASKIITKENNTEFDLTEDLHVYSCYRKTEKETDGETISVKFNWMGGFDGPKDYTFNPKTSSFHLGDKVPRHPDDNYYFEGWRSFGELVSETNYEQYVKDNEIRLYASWKPYKENPAKDAYQSLYGKGTMPDHMFLEEYESPSWTKISTFSYFAIKTVKTNSAGYFAKYDSTVLIVEYKDGKWKLKGESSSTGWKDQAEFEILTMYTNDNNAFAGILLFDVSTTLMSMHPVLQYFTKTMDYGTLWREMKASLKQGSPTDAVTNKVVSVVMDKVLKQLKKKLGDDDLAAKYVLDMAPTIRSAVKGGFDDCLTVMSDAVDVLSQTVSFTLDNADKVVEILEKTNAKVDNKIIASVSKKLKEYNDLKLGSEEIAETAETFSTGVGHIFDAFSLTLSVFMDKAELDKTREEAMDPFGNMNIALSTFYDQIEGLGFDGKIKEGFPVLIQKIYDAYTYAK